MPSRLGECGMRHARRSIGWIGCRVTVDIVPLVVLF
jgi:hypothetical protein